MPKDRIETRAKGHGEIEAVACKTHAHSDNEVRGPSVDRPIRYRHVNSKHIDLVLRSVSSHGVEMRVLVPQRFRNTVDEQTNCNTGRKDHSKLKKSGKRKDSECIRECATDKVRSYSNIQK